MKLRTVCLTIVLAASCATLKPIGQQTLTCAEEAITPIVGQFLADLAQMNWEAAAEKDVLRYGEATAACVFAYIQDQKSVKEGDDVIKARAAAMAAKLHYKGQF